MARVLQEYFTADNMQLHQNAFENKGSAALWRVFAVH